MRRRRKILLGFLAALATLGALAAWRVHTWGRPLPVAYLRVEMTPAGHEGGRSMTYLRLGETAAAGNRYVALDNDGDGTVDLVVTEGALKSLARPRADDPEARWLVICLDGVPFADLAALWEEGHFREFFRPAPLIAPFPTASGVALSEAFHTAPVEGYEDRYFDRARNRLAGGALMTTTGAHIPYLELLDYDMPGYLKGLAYTLPVKSYRADLGRFRTHFLASRAKIYLAHIASSDSLYHILSRAEMRQRLLEADALLRELYLDAGGKLRLTVFSDHGNSLAEGHRVPLREHLAAGGWRLAEQCGGPRDVAVPAYGLLGFFAVYCIGQEKSALADHLAQLPGADFVAYTDAGGVTIVNKEGAARLEWKPDGSAFRYQPLTADPLALSDVLVELKKTDQLDSEGWVSDADFFAATRHHRYPDPAYRLWSWATNHVHNRAEMVVSLRPGFHYGTSSFEWVVTMTSTHGSLDAAQTLGFAMSTDGPLTGPLRSGDLLPRNLVEMKKRRD